MEKPNTEDPDLLLWKAARNSADGDLRAFEELVGLYQKRILANCRYLTRDEKNYEDLAQDVFVKAFFGLKTFEGRSSFRGWLKKIKVNHCLTHLSKQQGKTSQSIEEEVTGSLREMSVPPMAESNLEARDQQARVSKILDSMPETLRIPLVMCDMDELSYEEVSSSLGIGLSAVKMRIQRARQLFRERYEAQ